MQDELPSPIINADEAPETERFRGSHWGAAFKSLTPSMRPRGGALGVNLMRVGPARAAVPFHAHAREDEVFFVLQGRGIFRYGDEPVREIQVGDCIACPSGTGIAHQIANPFDEDLVYLAIGAFDPHEVCTYPDNGKVMVRSLQKVGRLAEAGYMDGEPEEPKILGLFRGA